MSAPSLNLSLGNGKPSSFNHQWGNGSAWCLAPRVWRGSQGLVCINQLITEQPGRFWGVSFSHHSGPCLTVIPTLPALLRKSPISGHLSLIFFLFSLSLLGFGKNKKLLPQPRTQVLSSMRRQRAWHFWSPTLYMMLPAGPTEAHSSCRLCYKECAATVTVFGAVQMDVVSSVPLPWHSDPSDVKGNTDKETQPHKAFSRRL